MPYDRLQGLGEEPFDKILNMLMRGEPAMHVARLIQANPPTGWGKFSDVAEKTLCQQLTRLRLDMAEGLFGKRVAKRIADGHTPQIRLLKNVSIRAIDRLEEVSEAQRTLVMVLLKKATAEERSYASVNEAVDGYRKVLLDIQKIRFDLGLDEFRGPVSQTTVRGASQSTTLPDGTNIQKQVFEAVTTMERIFEQRKIPHVIQE